MGKMRKIPLKERLRRTADPQGGFSKDMIPVAAWMYAFGYFIHLSEMSTDLCYVNFLERMEKKYPAMDIERGFVAQLAYEALYGGHPPDAAEEVLYGMLVSPFCDGRVITGKGGQEQ